jgi:protein gp37
MNKTKIEWADMTWNPVTGCLHGCPYCYARKTAENPFYRKAFPYKFEPHFYPKRLNEPEKMKKPQTIFVCSMADLFGEWVSDLWIELIFAEIQRAKQHTYIFLTKNPKRYLKIPGTYFSKNLWFGATVTGMDDTQRICDLQKLPFGNKFVSFEPLLEYIADLDLAYIRQVFIGAQTNPSVEVTPRMVQPIGRACQDAHNIPIFCKDSMPTWAVRRELEWPLNKFVGRKE